MSRPPLDRVRVTIACPKTFASLTPEDPRDRFRHCSDCQRRVHDLSALTAREARRVLSGPERVCAQVVRRADGSLVLRPGRLRRVAGRLLRAASLLLLGLGGLLGACTRDPAQAPVPERVLEPTPDPAAEGTDPPAGTEAKDLEALRALGYVDFD